MHREVREAAHRPAADARWRSPGRVRPSPGLRRAWALARVFMLSVMLGVSSAGAQPTAELRVALVVGNANYRQGDALRNPRNDAGDMAAKLRALGFEVTLLTDVAQRDFNRAITAFGESIRPGATALFYYAGHAIQARGSNYLIPVDAEFKREASIRSEAVDVDQVLEQLAHARIGVVILDACRNNPFERSFRGGAGAGLAQIDAPKGVLIAYSTAPGRVADDGRGRNSPYTTALLAALERPERRIEDIFKDVRRAVTAATAERQLPWESSSLTGDFYFRPRATAVPAQGGAAPRAAGTLPAPASEALVVELAFWDSIKSSTQRADYEAYLRQYPNGRFAELAKARLSTLSKAAAGGGTRPAVASPQAAASRPATAPSFAVEAPAVRAGDRWRYVVTDRQRNRPERVFTEEVTALSAAMIRTRRTDEADQKVVEQSFDRQWNPYYTDRGVTVLQKWYEFPLVPGRSWSAEWPYKQPDGSRGRMSMTVSAEAIEPVDVRAGRFDSVRIRAQARWQLDGGGRRGRNEYLVWFSPQARRWVKFERKVYPDDGPLDAHQVTELAEYALKP